MEKTLKFKIITPEKIVYEDDIFQVTIPTSDGEITVLANHIPLVSVLKAGDLIIKDKNDQHHIAIAGGFLEVKSNNQIIILADNAERAEEIDLERAEEARKRAEKQMKQAKSTEDIDFAKLQGIIDREMNRIRVGKKYKKLPKARS
ncbi:MAG: F0F1 ATP synthase subunit epsilon [bacterium]